MKLDYLVIVVGIVISAVAFKALIDNSDKQKAQLTAMAEDLGCKYIGRIESAPVAFIECSDGEIQMIKVNK